MKKFIAGLTILTAFGLAAGGCQKNSQQTSNDKDATDWEVVVYTPKGDTAAFIISDDMPIGYSEGGRHDIQDKKTGKKVQFTTGTTVVAKEIPAVK